MLCYAVIFTIIDDIALSKKKKLPDEAKSSNKDERTRTDAEELVDVAPPIILSG